MTAVLTRFTNKPELDKIDLVIMDSADHVRTFRTKLCHHREAADIFEHVLCQVFEYVVDLNEVDTTIMEFCNECLDIIYGGNLSNLEGRNEMFNAIEEFSYAIVNTARVMGLFIDDTFIYSFNRLVGDDIVLGYSPQLTIQPTNLQRRIP